MQGKSYPVLCFGTFFTLVLREGVDNLSTKGFVGAGNKDKLTEVTAFLELNRIISPSFSPANKETFRGQASMFKSCVAYRSKLLPIVNASEVKTFLGRFENDYGSVFDDMSTFVRTYIHVDIAKRERLIKSLLELIRDDKEIRLDEKFYVNGNYNVLNKKELLCQNSFSFVSFLIGVFRYIVEFRRNDNAKGELTYRKWCPPANQALRAYSDDIYVGESFPEKIFFIEDDAQSFPAPMFKRNINVDISHLTGIDKADYLRIEAKTCQNNQDFDRSLQLYYESWKIYQEVLGIESHCAIKVFESMKVVFEQLDKLYSFAYWLENVAERGENNEQ